MGADVRARFQPSLALLHGGAGYPCRCGARRGACLLCCPPALPLVCFFAPIPPAPFPAGRGRPRLFHARGFAPCIPAAEPGRHRSRGANPRPAGACPAGCRFGGRWRHPTGACLLCRPPTLPLALFLPPSPQPPSRREGGDQGYFMQGASPLASPRLYPGGTGAGGRTTRPAGGLPGWLPVRRALAAPSGGLPSLSPAAPAFSLISFPHPPSPLPPSPLPPRGRGRPRLFHARGFAPCIPAAEPGRRWLSLPLWCQRGACLVGRLPPLPLVCLPASIPPSPFPAGRGGPKVYFAGGFAPGTPALNRLRHLQTLPNRYPAHGSLRFNAKPTERFPYEQCRQPRRGGTGGEELRRLRWFSPPGQVEPVPAGASQPQTPRGRDSQCRAGSAPPLPPSGYHSGKVSRRPPPCTPFPTPQFPTQSPKEQSSP